MNGHANVLMVCLESIFDRFFGLSQSTIDRRQLPLYRKSITEALKEFELKALEKRLDVKTIDDAKFACIALIDEWMIQELGVQSSEWASYPLQFEFFGENSAGEQFFEKLSVLRLDCDQNIDVLEVYYVCLELGYQGRYRLSEQPGAFIQLKKDLLSQIQKTRKTDDSNLFQTSPCSEPLLAAKSQMQYLHGMALAVVILVAVWGGCKLILGYQAGKVNQIVSQTKHYSFASVSKNPQKMPA